MSNESKQVAGYVPSAEAVEAGARAIAERHSTPEQVERMVAKYDWDDWLPNAPRDTEAALSAAVPVEVARLLKVLGEVRAQLGRIHSSLVTYREDDDLPRDFLIDGIDIACREMVDLWTSLDAVGVPAQVDEAATGGQSEVPDLMQNLKDSIDDHRQNRTTGAGQ